MDNVTKEPPTNTLKIAIFVGVLICIIVIIYYLYCYYASDDDDGFLGGGQANITVGWNIEDMVEKIHHRQRANLSRLSKDSQYNI